MKRLPCTRWILFIILVILAHATRAGTGYARQDGHWNDAGTWLFDGDGRKPTCGDSLRIDAGIAVTITAQENYGSCTSPLNIVVGGILQFINGFKLDLPPGSVITVLPGGMIRKITPGGGNSSIITICGGVVWAARDGDLLGPAVLVCMSPLPVSLLDFHAEAGETSVLLKWSTASEQNNDYFEIEKSADGQEYHSVATQAGAGTSSQVHTYQWNDLNPFTGITYYRLSQVDYDGKRTVYDPIVVRSVKEPVLVIAPNPAPSREVQFLYSGSEQETKASMIDARGQTVIQLPGFIIKPGQNALPAALPAGLYYLVLEMQDERLTEKVQIR